MTLAPLILPVHDAAAMLHVYRIVRGISVFGLATMTSNSVSLTRKQ